MLAEVLAQGSFGTALPEETEANARLIAAAPELLAALVGLYELCTLGASEDAFRNGVTDSHGIVDEGDARAFDRISAARAAIRKAGGENA
ncbi:hypothetical protein A3862_27240 [Methylobacterium sp. XJLW]|nr:hypothetical protein A3862_27240 [Methylobacterium sp. XJLW]